MMPPNNTSAPWSITSLYKSGTQASHTVTSHPWVDSPNVRGTKDILQSCILTLIACIYTALHLNVPSNSAWHAVLWTKIKWVIASLFAPEIVLYMAVKQFHQARKLKKALQDCERESRGKGPGFEVNMKYAFFVVMGGIRIDIEDLFSREDMATSGEPAVYHQSHKSTPTSARISPSGVIRLAKLGHWLPVPSEKINDKSKANYFQKFLIVTQVLWMVTQCIFRKISDLPLTLLEVHTMVHVACAIFLYAFWFQKPLDIQDAEIFSSENFKGEVALWVQYHFYSHHADRLVIFPPQSPENMLPPPDFVWVTAEPGMSLHSGEMMKCGLGLNDRHRNKVRSTWLYSQPTAVAMTHQFLKRWELIFSTFPFKEFKFHKRTHWLNKSYEEEEIPLWVVPTDEEDAGPRFLENLDMFPFNSGPLSSADRGTPFNFDQNFDTAHTMEFDKEFWMDTFLDHSGLTITLLLLSIIYGGIHLVAWNWEFPTKLESLAWKASCITIITALPVMGLILCVFSLSSSLGDAYIHITHSVTSLVGNIVMAAYMLTRIFIIAESFACLRQVPVGVYLSPAWLQMFPHL